MKTMKRRTATVLAMVAILAFGLIGPAAADTLLEPGDTGPEVYRLQNELEEWRPGIMNGPTGSYATARYGPRTLNAVQEAARELRGHQHPSSNYTVGPLFLGALESANGGSSQSTGGSSTATTSSSSSSTSGSGSVESVIRDVFGSRADAAIAIARCESNLNPRAFNGNDPHGGSAGVFQINGVHGDLNSFYDVRTNVEFAYQLSNGGTNFSQDWVICSRKTGVN